MSGLPLVQPRASGEGFASGFDCPVDVVLGVSGRDEGRFELAARQVDAAGEHLPEEAARRAGCRCGVASS